MGKLTWWFEIVHSVGAIKMHFATAAALAIPHEGGQTSETACMTEQSGK
jgi:hypothetical protein